MADLGFLLFGCSPAEQAARLRELRALALVYLGPAHPATIALAAAIANPSAEEEALAQIDTLPALRRRRLLGSYGALMPRSSRAGHRRAPVRESPR